MVNDIYNFLLNSRLLCPLLWTSTPTYCGPIRIRLAVGTRGSLAWAENITEITCVSMGRVASNLLFVQTMQN
jgi:hypothetical protein